MSNDQRCRIGRKQEECNRRRDGPGRGHPADLLKVGGEASGLSGALFEFSGSGWLGSPTVIHETEPGTVCHEEVVARPGGTGTGRRHTCIGARRLSLARPEPGWVFTDRQPLPLRRPDGSSSQRRSLDDLNP